MAYTVYIYIYGEININSAANMYLVNSLPKRQSLTIINVSFCPLIGHCSLVAISGKNSPTHAASNSCSQFPHLCTEKLSRTCCACSKGRSPFLPYRILPHLLSALIMVVLKMTYLEIFQSNIVKYTTNRYVDCNAVSWFSICR